MTPDIQNAMDWLLSQPEMHMETGEGLTIRVRVGARTFTAPMLEDAILEAYEVMHVEPARAEMRRSEG